MSRTTILIASPIPIRCYISHQNFELGTRHCDTSLKSIIASLPVEPTMVLGILIAALVAPGLLGSQEAIRQGQSKDKREEHRARRCNLIATCVKSSPRSREIDGRPVVLRNGKLWIDTTTHDGEPLGHTYAGYYLPYPDTKYEGLVTTITDVAPIMNWVYVDKETHEVKYGVRADAQPNLTGPFDCTRQDRRLTFDGWEGWCAVEEYEGYWCLYFDVDDDGLKSRVAPGTRVLEIELSRKEKRFEKKTETRQQDQTTKRTVDTGEDAPVDRPLQPETETKRPGVFNEPLPEPAPPEEVRPKTPPPAYSKTVKPVTPFDMQTLKKGAIDALDDFLAMESPESVAAPVSSTQPPRRSVSPSRVLQRPSPLSDKRITPKLNRNSGSKTIAQAQIFEAMAAARSQNDDVNFKRGLGSKRVSVASSFADSASVYSEEDQSMSREIRPQSSVSQRAYHQAPKAPPPVPTVRSAQLQTERDLKEPQQSLSVPSAEYSLPIDSAVFGASDPIDSIRRSQASSVSQPKRNSKTFTARRPGKRVSPRTSTRKSLTETMSNAVGNKKSLFVNKSTKLQAPSKTANRTQTGRKTTSTFLRDLDDLVSQEVAPDLLKGDRVAPASGRGLSAKREQRIASRRADKRPVRRV